MTLKKASIGNFLGILVAKGRKIPNILNIIIHMLLQLTEVVGAITTTLLGLLRIGTIRLIVETIVAMEIAITMIMTTGGTLPILLHRHQAGIITAEVEPNATAENIVLVAIVMIVPIHLRDTPQVALAHRIRRIMVLVTRLVQQIVAEEVVEIVVRHLQDIAVPPFQLCVLLVRVKETFPKQATLLSKICV
jgi:hypothetical protein